MTADSAPDRKESAAPLNETITGVAGREFSRLLAYESGARSGSDAEALHEMRVLSRRLCELLSLSARPGSKKDARPLRKGLKRLAHALGTVRDLDVLIERTESYAAARVRTDLSALTGTLLSERRTRLEKVEKYFSGSDYARLKEGAIRFAEGGKKKRGADGPASRDHSVGPSSVATILPAALLARYGRVRAYEGQIGDLGTPRLDRCHQLRIEAKRLRYLIEYFHEYLGPGSKPLIGHMKRLHDHLGRMQDSQTACLLIGRYLEKGALAATPSTLRYLEARRSELRRFSARVPPIMRQVSGGWFSRRLASLIGGL